MYNHFPNTWKNNIRAAEFGSVFEGSIEAGCFKLKMCRGARTRQELRQLGKKDLCRTLGGVRYTCLFIITERRTENCCPGGGGNESFMRDQISLPITNILFSGSPRCPCSVRLSEVGTDHPERPQQEDNLTLNSELPGR